MNRVFITAALCAITGLQANAAPLDSYTSYFAFGDSLTDDGKLGDLLAPPSNDGRYTNGITYAEIIAQNFDVNANYALGGATAGPVNQQSYPDFAQPLATLGGQVDVFLGSGAVDSAGANPLVSVLMGSNDFFQNIADPAFDPTVTVDQVLDAVARIAAAGSFDDFVIPFTPGAVPGTRFGDLGVAYNAYLSAQIPALEAQGLTIVTPDLDAASARIAADPLAYGITEPGFCAPTFRDPPNDENCTFVGLGADGEAIHDLSRADAYALADPIHPSGPVHEVWAATVTAAVEADPVLSPVPLPAGGVLLFGGLAALGISRRIARS